MARVTNDEVNDIYSDASDVDATPFIATANLIVTEDLADKGMSTGRLKQIELWLSAHFVAMDVERGGLRSKTVGDAKDVYAVQVSEGYNLTRFGQTAMSLDSSGVLRSQSKGAAQFRVV